MYYVLENVLITTPDEYKWQVKNYKANLNYGGTPL